MTLAAGLIALLLLGCAAGTLRVRSFRRLLEASLYALLALFAWLLAAAPVVAGGQRVMILAAGPADTVGRDVERVVERLREQGLVAWDVVAIGAASVPSRTDRWLDASDRWTPSSSAACGRTMDEALGTAIERLRRLPGVTRFMDLALRRTHRVVVAVSGPAPWWRDAVEVSAPVRSAAEAGVVVDLVTLDGEPLPLTVELECAGVAPANVRRPVFPVRARLRGPALGGPRSNIRVELELTVDAPGADRAMLRATVDATVLADRSALVSFSLADLERPDGTAFELPHGFHRLDLRAKLVGTRAAEGTATTYLEADCVQALLVLGRGGRTQLDPTSTPADLTESLAEAYRRLPRHSTRWPATVQLTATIDEDDLGKITLADYRLVVLHDLSDAAWAAHAKTLNAAVRDGLHLLVSLAPRLDRPSMADAAALLPASAGPETASVDRSWLWDRQPRVVVVLDPSRLGELDAVPTDRIVERAEPLIQGRRLQTEFLGELEARLDALARGRGTSLVVVDPTRPAATSPGGLVLTIERPAAGATAHLFGPSEVAARLLPLLQPADVQAIAGSGPSDRTGEVIRPGDVVVVFAHDVPQAPRVGPLARLLAHGATVVVVTMVTPYDRSEAAPAAAKSLRAALDEESAHLGGLSTPLSPATARGRLLRDGVWRVDMRAGADPASETTSLARDLVQQVEALVQARLPGAVAARTRPGGRIFDQAGQLVTASTATNLLHADPLATPPRRHQELVLRRDPAYAVVLAEVVDGSAQALEPRPLIVGGLHGHGHVVVAGYSILEGAHDALPPFFPTERLGDQVFVPNQAAADRWGVQRVLDLAEHAATLELPPGPVPVLRAVEALDAGRLRLHIVRKLDPGAPIPELTVTAGSSTVVVPLVGIDPRAQAFVHELLPSDLALLLGGAQAGTLSVAGSPVFVEVPSVASAGADLGALSALGAVAATSGGNVSSGLVEHPRPGAATRPGAVAGLVAILGGLWAARALARLGRLRRRDEETEREARRLREQLALASTLVQAGASIGRPQTSSFGGEPAGMRPLEPGDDVKALVRADLPLFIATGHPGVLRVLPRLSERATGVLILVHVGSSMRSPRSRGGPPKLLAAGLVAEAVAELAWRQGAEVSVRLVGVRDRSELEPMRASAGPGVVADLIVRAAGHAAAPADLPTLSDDDATAVVLVSDLLEHEDGEVLEFAARLEAGGGRFGAVHVSSRQELSLVDCGFSTAPLQVLDRSGLSPLEMEFAQVAFLARRRMELEGTRGGLVAVAANHTAAEIVEALVDSRLREVLS